MGEHQTSGLMEPIARLTRDLRTAAATMTDEEARYCVDLYYQIQNDRIRAGHQKRQAAEQKEPHDLFLYADRQFRVLETQIHGALERYCKAQPRGDWPLSIYGIGPVITAGLIAHIDVKRADTASAVWAFAGLAGRAWGKGEKRPHNAKLKRLCWIAGESFVKSGRFYRRLYDKRKSYETAKNERGEYAEAAEKNAIRLKAWAARKGKELDTEKMRPGMLSLMAIHERSKRYAVKIFLSHLWEVWRKLEGLPTRDPYIVQTDSVHSIIPVPEFDDELP